MRELTGRSALITGAAGGIGRATALCLARRGVHILAVDIDPDGLKRLEGDVIERGVSCRTYRVDVSDWKAVDGLGREIEQAGIEIDILINNAGVLAGGFLSDMRLESWQWVVGINLWGPIHFVQRFLPGMIGRGRGHVVNVASAAGIIGFPTIGAYSTTKFALVGLSQAMRAELARNGIGVTAVCPGIVKTGIVEAAKLDGIEAAAPAALASRGLPPEKVAAQIVRAIQRNTPRIFPTASSKFGYVMTRISPGLVRWALTRAAGRVAAWRKTLDPSGDRKTGVCL